jgi:hypothetical protein
VAPYHHQINTHHRVERARKVKKTTQLVVALFLLVSLGIGIDWLIGKINSDTTVVSNESTATVQSSTINLFRTPYFQFQADEKWVEAPEASTETRFVYKRLSGPLVEHNLVVYVNEKPPAKLAATRIFTAELDNGLFKKISGPDEHCNSQQEGLKNEPKIITYNQVTFNCDLGSATYKAFVGLIGGTNIITATRPNGETATYAIVYDDVTFSPTSNQINSIMSTFQIR